MRCLIELACLVFCNLKLTPLLYNSLNYSPKCIAYQTITADSHASELCHKYGNCPITSLSHLTPTGTVCAGPSTASHVGSPLLCLAGIICTLPWAMAGGTSLCVYMYVCWVGAYCL